MFFDISGMIIVKKNVIRKIFILIVLIIVKSGAQQDFDISGFSKRIQVDGFLMEWNGKSVKKWSTDSMWCWDAINTSNGVAGYIRSRKAVSCSSWVFILDPYGGTAPLEIQIPQDSATDYYSLDYQTYDSLKKVTFEWVLPWESIEADSEDVYSIRLTATNNCGDSLSSMLLIGSKKKQDGFFAKTNILHLILIFVSVYIVIAIVLKVTQRKNQTGRKGLPRR